MFQIEGHSKSSTIRSILCCLFVPETSTILKPFFFILDKIQDLFPLLIKVVWVCADISLQHKDHQNPRLPTCLGLNILSKTLKEFGFPGKAEKDISLQQFRWNNTLPSLDMQRKEWTQRKNASLSLIYVFISIYILKSYKCTLVKYCECTKSSKICSKDSFSSQPEQLKIQSTPTPSKDTGFIGVIKPPKQSNAGHGELSKVPPSTECCQPLAHVGATFSQLQRPNLSTAG